MKLCGPAGKITNRGDAGEKRGNAEQDKTEGMRRRKTSCKLQPKKEYMAAERVHTPIKSQIPTMSVQAHVYYIVTDGGRHHLV